MIHEHHNHDPLLVAPISRVRMHPRVHVPHLGVMPPPKVDVHETETALYIVAEVPGVVSENMEIDVREDRVSIHGRMEKEVVANAKPYLAERSYGEFYREFSLPVAVDEDRVTAVTENGVITIILPKAEGEHKHNVRIEQR